MSSTSFTFKIQICDIYLTIICPLYFTYNFDIYVPYSFFFVRVCEHHSQIIKSCLVMKICHFNCEKGYKVYNISDNDNNQWRTSLKVDSNMSRGQ